MTAQHCVGKCHCNPLFIPLFLGKPHFLVYSIIRNDVNLNCNLPFFFLLLEKPYLLIYSIIRYDVYIFYSSSKNEDPQTSNLPCEQK